MARNRHRDRSPSQPVSGRGAQARGNLPVLAAGAIALLVLAAIVAITISASGKPSAAAAPSVAVASSLLPSDAAGSASTASAPTAVASGSHALSGSVTVGSAVPSAVAASPSTGAPANDIKCESTEQVTYHVHAHLAILVDGKMEVVPKGIGITDLCLYWLHTHADSGIIHVEAPVQVDFRLGQFFDIWRKPLDGQNLGPYRVTLGEHLYAFVNGAAWTADPRSIPLIDHQVIELQVGKGPIPPSPYQFPPGY